MTEEQITELERVRMPFRSAEYLIRLLEERKRLLAGCKQAAVQHRSMPLNYDEWEKFIYATIAYAEEAAP